MEKLEESLAELRETFTSRRTRSAAWRKAQLKGLKRMLEEQQEEIFKVLREDLGKPKVEAFRDEVGFLLKSLNLALSCVKKWMKTKKQMTITSLQTKLGMLPKVDFFHGG